MKTLDVLEGKIRGEAQRRFEKFKKDLRNAIEPFSRKADCRNLCYLSVDEMLEGLIKAVSVSYVCDEAYESEKLQALLLEQATDAVIKPSSKKQ